MRTYKTNNIHITNKQVYVKKKKKVWIWMYVLIFTEVWIYGCRK